MTYLKTATKSLRKAKSILETQTVRIAVPAIRVNVRIQAPEDFTNQDDASAIDLYRGDLKRFTQRVRSGAIVPLDRVA